MDNKENKANSAKEEEVQNSETTVQENQTDETAEKTTEEQAGEQEQKAEPEQQDDLEKKHEEKVKELNEKYLRLYSEFENYRRRTAKEKLDMMSNAGSDIVRDLLPVLDDFERAIVSIENSEDVEAIKEGFSLIHNKLQRNLEQKGLKGMDAKGKDFDTEYHEAITNIPAPSEDLKGKVVDVAEKGYFYKDKILRYAKVIVGQ